jgi:hypothetical protein
MIVANRIIPLFPPLVKSVRLETEREEEGFVRGDIEGEER